MFPKLEWDQRRKHLCLRIKLENLKEMQLNYTNRSIFFRATVKNVKYGFDLDFYAEILPENAKVVHKEKYTNIYLEKKCHAEWPRLLATQIRVS